MRVIKPYSPIAWFATLNTSFKDQKSGVKSVSIYPEHPRTYYMGAETDDWPTLSINLKMAAQEVIVQITSIILHHDLVSYYSIG